MYFSLLQYEPTDREKLIHTGREALAVEAARRYFVTIAAPVGIVSASDCADDCQPTHVIIHGVVYKLTEVMP